MASILPEDTVYSGPQSPGPKRVTLRVIKSKYAKGEPLSVVTAYDYPSAVHVSNTLTHCPSGRPPNPYLTAVLVIVRPCLVESFGGFLSQESLTCARARAG
jgi:hypothetical protein